MNPLDEAAKESSAHNGPISSARDDYALASPLQVVVDTQDGALPLSVLVAAMPAQSVLPGWVFDTNITCIRLKVFGCKEILLVLLGTRLKQFEALHSLCLCLFTTLTNPTLQVWLHTGFPATLLYWNF